MDKPRLDQGPDYERGFIDGMMYQTQSSVDKAVNQMTQPKQEPVAWWNDTGTHIDLNVSGRGIPLYTTPPQQVQESVNINCPSCLHSFAVLPVTQRTWVGLTEDEAFACQGRDYFETYKAIEARLKEKNT
jgi:hypothetical protein